MPSTFPHVQWLENEFLGYLYEWRASIASREGFTSTAKARMCLSRETLEGLYITGMHVILWQGGVVTNFFFTLQLGHLCLWADTSLE